MRLLVLLAGLVLLVPASHAVQAEIDRPTEPIVPGEPWNGTLLVAVDCAEVVPPQAQATWTAEVDTAGVHITGPSQTEIDTSPCLTGAQEVTAEFPIEVMGTLEAPGETPIHVGFQVDVDGVEESAETELQVVMEWVGAFDVKVDRTEGRAGPQKQIEYELEITNLGNARTIFEFHIEDGGALAGDPVAPSPFILGSANQGAEMTSGVVTLVYSTPFENGRNDVSEDFVVTITSESTKSGQTGPSESITLAAQTKGYYVPGPGLFLMVAGIALLARLRRV